MYLSMALYDLSSSAVTFYSVHKILKIFFCVCARFEISLHYVFIEMLDINVKGLGRRLILNGKGCLSGN